MRYALLRRLSAVTFCAALLAPAIASADDDYYQDEDQGYPMELVRRPLVLKNGMLEVRLGGASDVLAASSASQIRSQLDATYAPFTRGQVGFESDLYVAGDTSFQVGNVAGWAEYNVH